MKDRYVRPSALEPDVLAAILGDDPTTSEASEGLRKRAQAVEDLVIDKHGTVEGAAFAWTEPIAGIRRVNLVAKAVFGEDLPEDPILQLGEYAFYTPTVFEGVHARLLAVTIDEERGPGFSLDLTAEPLDTIPQGPQVWPTAQGLFFQMYMKPRLP